MMHYTKFYSLNLEQLILYNFKNLSVTTKLKTINVL